MRAKSEAVRWRVDVNWVKKNKNKKMYLKIPCSDVLTWHTLTCGLLLKRKLAWYVVLARCLHTVRENVATLGHGKQTHRVYQRGADVLVSRSTRSTCFPLNSHSG